MNKHLDSLHPYPFEKLNGLVADVTPPDVDVVCEPAAIRVDIIPTRSERTPNSRRT